MLHESLMHLEWHLTKTSIQEHCNLHVGTGEPRDMVIHDVNGHLFVLYGVC